MRRRRRSRCGEHARRTSDNGTSCKVARSRCAARTEWLNPSRDIAVTNDSLEKHPSEPEVAPASSAKLPFWPHFTRDRRDSKRWLSIRLWIRISLESRSNVGELLTHCLECKFNHACNNHAVYSSEQDLIRFVGSKVLAKEKFHTFHISFVIMTNKYDRCR